MAGSELQANPLAGSVPPNGMDGRRRESRVSRRWAKRSEDEGRRKRSTRDAHVCVTDSANKDNSCPDSTEGFASNSPTSCSC